MAIWRIPNEYIIDWTQNGDDVHSFSRKVKYCLEEAFTSLEDLHDTTDNINESIQSISTSISSINSSIAAVNSSLSAISSIGGGISDGNSSLICGIGVEIASIENGQILVYREEDEKFHNEDNDSKLIGGVDIKHLMRLVENLYLALDVAGLNPGGYDGLSGETFYGDTNDINAEAPKVLSFIQGDDTLTLGSPKGLIENSVYRLTDGSAGAWVRIKQLRTVGDITQVVLYNPVNTQFTGTTRLRRSRGTISEGKITCTTTTTNGTFFTTDLIPFVNEVTGEEKLISRAHLIVKHQNLIDTEIRAEIALRETATFVKGELIGVGNDLEQTATLAHRTNLSSYKFTMYFDGVAQEKNFSFDATTGRVTFTAPANTVVSVDYFYNWSEENFVEMTKVGTYPDRRNPNRATTQFAYKGTAGKIATLRLRLRCLAGTSENEIVSTGAGLNKPIGFKLVHQAIPTEIQVVATDGTYSYNEDLNTVVVAAPAGQAINISYGWRGKSFSVDSFVCMFDE